MTAFLETLDGRIGIDRLRALHLNDSQMPFGSNRDRHANIGEGLIGEDMAAFLGHPRLQGLPCVLETPGHDGHGVDPQCLASAHRLHAAGLALYA
jgi:deoxyribonuclease-4